MSENETIEIIEKYKLIANSISAKKKNNIFSFMFRRSSNKISLLKSYANYMREIEQEEVIQRINEDKYIDIRLKKNKYDRSKLVSVIDGKEKDIISAEELYACMKSEYNSIVSDLGKNEKKILGKAFKKIDKGMSYIPNRIAKTAMIAVFAAAMSQTPLISGATNETIDKNNNNKNVNTPIAEKAQVKEVKREMVKIPVKLSEISLNDEMREKIGDNSFGALKNALKNADKIEKVNKILYESGLINNKGGEKGINSMTMAIYGAESTGGAADTELANEANAIGPMQSIKEFTVPDLYEKLGGKGLNNKQVEQQWEYVIGILKEKFGGKINFPDNDSYNEFAKNEETAFLIQTLKSDLQMDRIRGNIDSGMYNSLIKEAKERYPEECKNNPNFIVTYITMSAYNGDPNTGQNRKYRPTVAKVYIQILKAQEKEYMMEWVGEKFTVYDLNGNEILHSDKGNNEITINNLKKGIVKTADLPSKKECVEFNGNNDKTVDVVLSDKIFGEMIVPIAEVKAIINEASEILNNDVENQDVYTVCVNQSKEQEREQSTETDQSNVEQVNIIV
ncbi:MAG TPA: hypothetical protein DEP72_04675 [Clostridiales bacterium]|nr:MAG: hypothetical protein A2Y18_05470 [Clostridiales bacterium GWD2_32_19]HCC07437.1 hypothetical protein [Clostridiales bacterium]